MDACAAKNIAHIPQVNERTCSLDINRWYLDLVLFGSVLESLESVWGAVKLCTMPCEHRMANDVHDNISRFHLSTKEFQGTELNIDDDITFRSITRFIISPILWKSMNFKGNMPVYNHNHISKECQEYIFNATRCAWYFAVFHKVILGL